MVKWINKVFRYTRTIMFWVKGLKVVAERCLNRISFQDDFCCCVGGLGFRVHFTVLAPI